MDKFEVEAVKKNNLYESVSDTLEKMILEDTLKVGERLPSEAAMAENFGVSRNVIREALKVLKERHLIEISNGDGARVIKPDSHSLKDAITRMVVMGSVSLPHIYELRKSMEVSAAGLAAQRRTEEQVHTLYRIIDDMWENRCNRPRWIQLDLEFHGEIARASGNPLFYEFIQSLSGALEYVFDKGYYTPGAHEKSVQMHRSIVDAVCVRDREAAEENMRVHLRQSSYDSSFDKIRYKELRNESSPL